MLFSDAAVETVQGSLPDWLALLFAAVTMLGDPWLVVPVLALTYWYGSRDWAAPLYAGVLGGMALVLVGKALLGSPRPTVAPPVPAETVPAIVRPVYEQAVHQEGSGLPSGHAAIATLLWGTVGLAVTGPARRHRVAAVGAVVALVACSRVVLGVHYPIDVVAGVGAGCLVLAAVVVHVRRGLPVLEAAFLPAVVVAGCAVVVYGPATETFAVVGGLIGGTVGYYWSRDMETAPQFGLRDGAVGIAGIGTIGGVVALVVIVLVQIVRIVLGWAPPAQSLVVLVGTVALGIWIFMWPTIIRRSRHHRYLHRLLRAR